MSQLNLKIFKILSISGPNCYQVRKPDNLPKLPYDLRLRLDRQTKAATASRQRRATLPLSPSPSPPLPSPIPFVNSVRFLLSLPPMDYERIKKPFPPQVPSPPAPPPLSLNSSLLSENRSQIFSRESCTSGTLPISLPCFDFAAILVLFCFSSD